MKKHYQRLAVLIVFGIVGWVPSVFAQTDFYKGKTITVYIGTTPGRCTINGAGFSRSIWVSIFPASRT